MVGSVEGPGAGVLDAPGEPVQPPEAPGPSAAGMRRRRLVLVALLLLAMLWAAAAALLTVAARSELLTARGASERGIEALRAADVRQAQRDLAAAEAAFIRASGRLGSPLVSPGTLLPVVGDDLRTVAALAQAGVLASRAGEGVTRAALELPGGPGSLAPTAGRLPVDALQALGPSVTEARDLIDEARAMLAATDETALLEPVAQAHEAFAEHLDEAAGMVALVEPLVRVLPEFLGSQGPRRYFFAAAQPAELRGATGFIGAYSIMTADQGRFWFDSFNPIQDLQDQPADLVEPPNPDFIERYGAFGGPGVWRNLNVSPDFPTTGVAIERLWEATTGERLDGTISADPFALAALLEVAGPVEVPGSGPLDAASVVPFVSNEAYGVFADPEQRKRLLGDIASAALAGFLSDGLKDGPDGKDDPETALRALQAIGEAARDGHLLVHAADPAIQHGLEAAGLAGRLLDPPGDYFAAILNGASGSKVDYYLGRQLDYRITLAPDGSGQTHVSLLLVNDAPSEGVPAYVIGPFSGRGKAGDTELYVSAYLPSGATLSGFSVDGRAGEGRIGPELGHPVVETFQHVPSGTRRELTYQVSHPRAWEPDGEGGRYRLTVQEQSTIRATEATLEIQLPQGMHVLEADERLEVDDGRARFAGEIRGTIELELAFGPPESSSTLGTRLRDWLAGPLLRIGG